MMYRHEDYETAVEMIAAGKIVPDPLLSRTFPFEESREAYRFIDEQGDKIMKVMIGLE
jgi:threonine dehydrogenase-like Zn-dependent dehydrogenase